MKTRIANFFNLPELMNMYKNVADIKTAEMLDLKVPKLHDGKPVNIVAKPTKELERFIKDLGIRADRIRSGRVKPYEDNMLLVTTEGRKAALSMRLIDPSIPDDPNSKINMAVDNVNSIFWETEAEKSTQLIFCDTSTPNSYKYNVYDDIREKLMMKGIPKEQIAFIHEYDTDREKEELREKVRNGDIRILTGSTAKMGEGMNVQKRLKALHHIDIPWTPDGVKQRDGRVLRQGNDNEFAWIFRYVTEGSFDAYSWQLLENKQRFISQIESGKYVGRTAADIDEAVLSYAEVKALTCNNPLIKEKIEVDIEVERLRTLKVQHNSNIYSLEHNINKGFPKEIEFYNSMLEKTSKDLKQLNNIKERDFSIQIGKNTYTDKSKAGAKILKLASLKNLKQVTHIGYYKGFELNLERERWYSDKFQLSLINNARYATEMGDSDIGNITRLDNAISNLPQKIEDYKMKIENTESQIEAAKNELKKPFRYEDALKDLLKRQSEISIQLDLGEKDVISDCIDEEDNQMEENEISEEFEDEEDLAI